MRKQSVAGLHVEALWSAHFVGEPGWANYTSECSVSHINVVLSCRELPKLGEGDWSFVVQYIRY